MLLLFCFVLSYFFLAVERVNVRFFFAELIIVSVCAAVCLLLSPSVCDVRAPLAR